MAKIASHLHTDSSYLKCPSVAVRNKLYHVMIAKWNEDWINSPNGSVTKNIFFPTVYDRLNSKFVEPGFIFTQFLSGHGKFNSYFERFNIRNENGYNCKCGEITQTVQHLLFSCPLFYTKRFQVELNLDNCNLNYEYPLNIKIFVRKCCHKMFLNFIHYIFNSL